MSIFRRDSDSPAPSAKPSSSPSRERSEPAGAPATTLVAKGSKITGRITGQAPIHVAGEVDGSIRLEQGGVLVSSDGYVEGDVQARNIRIGGKVRGDVQATEKVEVTPSGSLEGNIRAPRVILEEGAFFKGQVEMASEPRREPARKKPPAVERPERPERSERPQPGSGPQGGKGGSAKPEGESS